MPCGLLCDGANVWSGYAAESTRLFDIGVRLLRMDTIIRETANDPSTIGRAYSVTVLLGTICRNWGTHSNEIKKTWKGEMKNGHFKSPSTTHPLQGSKSPFPLRSQLHRDPGPMLGSMALGPKMAAMASWDCRKSTLESLQRSVDRWSQLHA